MLAYSSQHIVAKPRATPNQHSTTIQFSLLTTTSNGLAPNWSFTLPELPTTHQPTVDHLLFSPDGKQLLVCTQINQLLRLSILTQANSRADHWELTWDHLLPPKQNRSISKACFLNEPRRWFTEPASDPSDQNLIDVCSTKYHHPKRTPNSSVNFFCQGRGQTAVLVLTTNELLVIHIPLPQLNLPPHILLTRLDNSAVVQEHLKLLPTPTQHASRNPPHPDPHPTGLQPAPSREPNSPHVDRSTRNHHPLSSSTDFNTTPNQKEITMASIGLPACSARSFDQQVDQPRILIAFQTKITPRIPTSTFQTTVVTDSTEDHEAKTPNHQDDFQLTMGIVEDDLGQFITGLGDLDDAFDTPMLNSEAKNNKVDEKEKAKQPEPSDDPTATTNLQENSDSKKMEICNKSHPKNHSRRFEPNLGIHDDHPSIGIPFNSPLDSGDPASFALFIQLVEVHIDFDDPDLLPTVAIQQLPNLPIIDSFDHTKTTQVVLRTLEFIAVTSNSNQETNSPLLRLLAGYSRELDPPTSSDRSDFTRIAWVDELQTWDLRFLHSRLSNAFLAIDCLVDRNRAASSSPELLLRGPHEWIFTRSANKALTELKNNVELHSEDKKSDLRICKILVNWKVRNGCVVLIVKKNADGLSAAVNTTTTQNENEDENPTPRKRRKTMETDMTHRYEAIIFNSKDLTTAAVIPLPPSLSHREANQLCLSYHGVWCCSIDECGKLRTSPLITSNQAEWIVSLIVSAIHNHESVDDISRFVNSEMAKRSTSWKTQSREGIETSNSDTSELNHILIFRQISSFLAHLGPPFRISDVDRILSPSWRVGFDLWSAAPGYQKAAEIALIGRQLFATLTITLSVRSEGYSRSLWPMIGTARWYVKLAQRIVGSIDPDSKSAHLAILPTTGDTFSHLFRLAMNLHHFSIWLQAMNTQTINNYIHQGQDYPKVSFINPSVSFQDEVQVARLVFNDIWDHSNPIRMEAWGRFMQEMCRMLFRGKPDEDPVRPIENFSIPLSALDPKQVNDSVEMLRGMINSHQHLLKPKTTTTTSNNSNNNNMNRTPIVQSTPTMTMATSANLAGAEGGVSEDDSNEKRLALIKEIGSKINVEEDRKNYDILTGAKLEYQSSNHHDDKKQLKKKKSNAFRSNNHIKQCFKCKARSSTLSWNPRLKLAAQHDNTIANANQPDLILHHHNLLGNNHSLIQDSFNINPALTIGQFDLSLKEFNHVCFCGGLWVSPSSP